ncbi:MAG: Fic family protein [Brumimicrobium sp.]|nr:Fic family protein [Brumimicrobium sp.]
MEYKLNPDRNKPWNELPTLPIDSKYYITIPILEQLAKTKFSIGRLQGRSIAIPNQGILVNSISLQEAKASSAIENIFTTDDELYKAFSQTQPAEQLSGTAKEVLKYREAIWEGFSDIQGKENFDINYFEKVYRVITGHNDGMRPPFAQTYIKTGGSGPNAGKPFYTPPRGEGIIENKMDNFIHFLNDDDNYPIDPLLKMCIAHFQLEAIHPFRDGNGRTGRVFNIHFLTKKGLLDYPILYLSRYILEHKDDYYQHLAGVTQRGAWENWIIYLLKAVEVTAHITYTKITDILNVKDAILKEIQNNASFKNPEFIVSALFTQPYTTVKHLQTEFSENTARKYLDKLAEMKVVEKKISVGKAYYLNVELTRILAE